MYVHAPEERLMGVRLDVEAIKKDFPTLRREVYDKPIVYLDSAASSQTPQPVLDAMEDYYDSYRSNTERGVYLIATEATDAYERARARIAAFVDAPPAGTVFTRNTTESINLVAYSWVRRRLGVLPSSQLIDPRLTAIENMMFASKIFGMERAEAFFLVVSRRTPRSRRFSPFGFGSGHSPSLSSRSISWRSSRGRAPRARAASTTSSNSGLARRPPPGSRTVLTRMRWPRCSMVDSSRSSAGRETGQ
jgi:hypothetical protein